MAQGVDHAQDKVDAGFSPGPHLPEAPDRDPDTVGRGESDEKRAGDSADLSKGWIHTQRTAILTIFSGGVDTDAEAHAAHCRTAKRKTWSNHIICKVSVRTGSLVFFCFVFSHGVYADVSAQRSCRKTRPE